MYVVVVGREEPMAVFNTRSSSEQIEIGSEPSIYPSQRDTAIIRWRLAIETLGRKFSLKYLELSAANTPVQAVETIRGAYRAHTSLPARLFQRLVLLRRPIIESATISGASFINVGTESTSSTLR